MSRDSPPFITARPSPSILPSPLHRPLSFFNLFSVLASLCSPSSFVPPLFFFSLLLQLIIFESLIINRINVFSDALCHALVPLSCFTVFGSFRTVPSLACTVVRVSQATASLLPLFEVKKIKSLGSINPGSGAAVPYTSTVHQRHSSKHLKQHRFDIELGDVSLAEPD